jgi:hypothetical protein
MLFFGSRFSPAINAMMACRERAASNRRRLAEFGNRIAEKLMRVAESEIIQ